MDQQTSHGAATAIEAATATILDRFQVKDDSYLVIFTEPMRFANGDALTVTGKPKWTQQSEYCWYTPQTLRLRSLAGLGGSAQPGQQVTVSQPILAAA